MTADDALVTCSCGTVHRYDTDPHEWKPRMTDTDIDALARVISQATAYSPNAHDLADAILASDWLAAREREAAAKAWDEGFQSGETWGHALAKDTWKMLDDPVNPYRADTYKEEQR